MGHRTLLVEVDVKVLVVEDDPKIAAVVRRGLELEGFTVATAADGDEGWWMATEGVFDVDLPTSGPVFQELYKQLMDNLKRVDVHIPGWPHDTPCPDSPHRLPFVLLCAKGNGPVKTHDPYDELTATTFTLANMRQLRFGLVDMYYHGQKPTGESITEVENRVDSVANLFPRVDGIAFDSYGWRRP